MGSCFYKDWHRYDFQIRAQSAPINQFSVGLITCDIDNVIVADIPISIYITASPTEGIFVGTTQSPYQSIYCSYSHEDISVVERVDRAAKLLGSDYMQQMMIARREHNDSVELLAMIDRADIFQLFWSEAAARSDYVEKEWRYAYSLGRTNFIRPVYWVDLIPTPPQELASLVFTLKFGLWIELKYEKMPIEQLNMDERTLNKWRSYGFTRVSEILEFFENINADTNDNCSWAHQRD